MVTSSKEEPTVSNHNASLRSATAPTPSYSRRTGDYLYDVKCYQATMPARGDHFFAFVMNMVCLESGLGVPVNAGLQDEYGATTDEAIATITAAVDAWVQGQTRSERFIEPYP
jgi:hypothetical protein